MKRTKDSIYRTLCLKMVEAIVSKPEEVEISVEEENGIHNISLKVAKEDMGRVIGKGGKIIKAIRNLLRIRAIKEGERVNLSLIE